MHSFVQSHAQQTGEKKNSYAKPCPRFLVDAAQWRPSHAGELPRLGWDGMCCTHAGSAHLSPLGHLLVCWGQPRLPRPSARNRPELFSCHQGLVVTVGKVK